MKKNTLLLASVVMAFFFVSTFLQGLRLLNNHSWAFMEDLAFINQYALCLFILPLYWYHQYKLDLQQANEAERPGWTGVAYATGFFCSEALVNAVFLTDALTRFILAAVLGVIYVPLYFFRKNFLISDF
jgi:hypothetical protein